MARLNGDPACVPVERAVLELRRGRAVVLRGASDSVLVAAAEALGGEDIAAVAAELGRDAGLILSAPRLRHMDIDAGAPMRLSLANLAADEIVRLFMAPLPPFPFAPLRTATPIEIAALDLVRQADILPAAVVLPATAAPKGLVTVETGTLERYPDRAVQDLRIVARAPVPLDDAPRAEFVVFSNGSDLRDQIAIVVGPPDPAQPVLTRLHSACLTGDLFSSLKCDCGDQLRLAVQAINAAGSGLLLYLDQEGRGIGLRNKMRAYGLQAQGHDTVDADAILGYGPDERRYEVAGRMLELLGYRRIVMLSNNPDKIRAIEQTGVTIEGHQRLIGGVNPHNAVYLATKATRAGHLLGSVPASSATGHLRRPPAKSPPRPRRSV